MDDLHDHFEELGEVTARSREAHLKRLQNLEVLKSRDVPPEAIYLFHSMIENKSPHLEALAEHLAVEHDLGDLVHQLKNEYRELFHAVE